MNTHTTGRMAIHVLFGTLTCLLLALVVVHRCGAEPPQATKIAYASNADGNLEIYTMNPDGSGVTRLTRESAKDAEPKWSPDGKKIAFKTTRDGNDEIYVMDSNGSNPVNVTQNAATDEDCSWSPDSKELCFASNRDGNFEIYLMRADGTNIRRLTSNQSKDLSPSVSPDGKFIVFVSWREEMDGIHIMNYDGTGVRRLPTTGGNPRWSPDGKTIVIHHATDGNMDIWTINANGTGMKRLTDHQADDSLSSYSPDGTKIAFVSTRDGKPAVYTMNKDGMDVHQVSPKGQIAISSCWSPLLDGGAASKPVAVLRGTDFQLEVTGPGLVKSGSIEIKGRRLQTTFVTLPIRLRNLTSQKRDVNVSDAFTLHHPEQADAFRLLKEKPGPFVLEFAPGGTKDCEIQYIMNPEAPSLRGGLGALEWETFLGRAKIPLRLDKGQ